jgi:hypothetical protein
MGTGVFFRIVAGVALFGVSIVVPLLDRKQCGSGTRLGQPVYLWVLRTSSAWLIRGMSTAATHCFSEDSEAVAQAREFPTNQRRPRIAPSKVANLSPKVAYPWDQGVRTCFRDRYESRVTLNTSTIMMAHAAGAG